jgi:hypothetical protein
MNTFPAEEALVAAYLRRLARSIDSASAEKRRKTSSLKSHARAGVRQYLATSRNIEPAIPTRPARASRLRNGGHQHRKINLAMAAKKNKGRHI